MGRDILAVQRASSGYLWAGCFKFLFLLFFLSTPPVEQSVRGPEGISVGVQPYSVFLRDLSLQIGF